MKRKSMPKTKKNTKKKCRENIGTVKHGCVHSVRWPEFSARLSFVTMFAKAVFVLCLFLASTSAQLLSRADQLNIALEAAQNLGRSCSIAIGATSGQYAKTFARFVNLFAIRQ